MRKYLYHPLLIFLLGCHSNNSSTDKAGFNIRINQPYHKARPYSCDSLIEILVRESNPNIQSWYNVRVASSQNDSVAIEVYATNGKGDTIVIEKLFLLPNKGELWDDFINPISPTKLTINENTMELIKSNCILMK